MPGKGQARQPRNVTLTPARIVHLPPTSVIHGCSITPNIPAQSVQVRVIPTPTAAADSTRVTALPKTEHEPLARKHARLITSAAVHPKWLSGSEESGQAQEGQRCRPVTPPEHPPEAAREKAPPWDWIHYAPMAAQLASSIAAWMEAIRH
jgi:hypothetical protein